MYGPNPLTQFNLPEDIVTLAETSAKKVLDFVFNENAELIKTVMSHPEMTQGQKNQFVSLATARWSMLHTDLGIYTEYRERKERAEEFERRTNNAIPGNPMYAGNPYQLGGYVNPGVPSQGLSTEGLNPLMNTGHPPHSNMVANSPLHPGGEYVFNYDGRQFEALVIRSNFEKIDSLAILGLRAIVSAVLNDEENNDAVAFIIEFPDATTLGVDYGKFMEQLLPGLLAEMNIGDDEFKLSWTVRKNNDGLNAFYVDLAPDQDSLDHESFSDTLRGNLINVVYYNHYFDVPAAE